MLVSRSKKRRGSPVKPWEAFRAIEAENCVLHNVAHIRNVVLREGNRSPVIIDFGQADIRKPELSDEGWSGVVWGVRTCVTRETLLNLKDGPWKRTVTLYVILVPHYRNPLVFNSYGSGPEDYHWATFERGLDTDAPMADTTGRSLQTYLWLASLFVVLQSYKSSTATNEANPFHMKEAYEDIPIQSIDAVEFVDVKHVQTHPDICRLFSHLMSLAKLTLTWQVCHCGKETGTIRKYYTG